MCIPKRKKQKKAKTNQIKAAIYNSKKGNQFFMFQKLERQIKQNLKDGNAI